MNCKSCGARILWAVTPAGKKIPLDAEPHPDGNIAISHAREWAPILASVVKPGSQDGLRKTHFATCPNSVQHRKKQPGVGERLVKLREAMERDRERKR